MIAWLFLLAAAPGAESATKATQTLAASCLDHKFETVVHMTGPDGQPKGSKVKICGKPGQSDSDWLGTLKDALDKVTLDPKMSTSVRAQLVAALTAEIARLTPAPVPEPTPAPAPTLAAPALAPPASGLAARTETERAPEYSTYAP
ncbi:MAG TPA: hypothetical protein VF079_02955, partial [Sphingomicrobium sp.]